MKRKLIIACACASAAASLPLYAQTDELGPESQRDTKVTSEIMRLDVEARADFQWLHPDGGTDDGQTGFKGKYLTMRIDGQITDGLTYSWRQRFNKNAGEGAFFDATDWVYLNYYVDRWNFQIGKEVVAIGGYEYDRNPIDLYQCSVFWNNVPCYQFGVSAGYDITPTDRLTFQVVQSPFHTKDNSNMYGYNLMWSGNHGFYQSLWTANLFEYAKGKYINYFSLGNKFTVDKVWLELDFMNRAASHQAFLLKDCSVMAELSYNPTRRWRVFGKYTYDVNHSGTAADLIVENGTELSMAGAGVEFFPLASQRHRLRLHAAGFYSWGKNANLANEMQNKTFFLTAGITWDMNLLNIHRK